MILQSLFFSVMRSHLPKRFQSWARVTSRISCSEKRRFPMTEEQVCVRDTKYDVEILSFCRFRQIDGK